ncbi:hypothetical protein ACFSQD_04345 [Flavihumibacter stibioxidans]|uniref:Uncharacterized protein n=1 Tax=Flavihumibacter stibioxidans TaxID=1834163 RepID=A0ABR7M3F1_9BACT|nr:hypothetical protein [Flavihumibacter stibioxidans]MBC6489537.1 hypothetical protein [Flavihumibacter stibioxidans]
MNIASPATHLGSKPVSLNLLSPIHSFYYPNRSLPVICMAVPNYGVLKPFTKWHLRDFIMKVKDYRDMIHGAALAVVMRNFITQFRSVSDNDQLS